MNISCYYCGRDIKPDDSPGVWLHAEGDDDLGLDCFDIDGDHVATPEEDDS